MSNQIELIVSKQAQKQLDDLYTALGKSYDEIIKINQTQITLNGGGSPKSLADFNAKIAQQEKLIERNRLAEIKLQQAREKAFDIYERNLNKEQAKLEASQSIYSKVQAKLNALQKEYRDLAIQKELTGKLTDAEAKRYDFLSSKITKYDQTLKAVDGQMGKYQRNVGNYAGAFNPLSNSINQLSREMPAFANSVQTGFMAISNNLPIFFDSMSQIIKQNKELQAQGKPTESVFKQLAASLFSWGTALSLGVTLLTVYGAQIWDSVSGSKARKEALDREKEAIEQKARAEEQAREKLSQLQSVEVSRSQILFENAKNVTLSYSERLKAVEELQTRYPDYLGNLSKEQILAGDTAEAELKLNDALVKRGIALSSQQAIQDEISNSLKNEKWLADKLLEVENKRKKLAEELQSLNPFSKNEKVIEQYEKTTLELGRLYYLEDTLNKQYKSKNKTIQDSINFYLKQYNENAKYINSVKEETSETKKSTKAKLEKSKVEKQINKNTEDWFLAEISRLEKIRNATETTTEAYKSYNKQLDFLKFSLKVLRGELDFSEEGLKLDLEKMGLTADAFDKFRKGGKDAKEVLEETSSYLKGFYDQFGSESGMPTLFKVLNKEIDGFGDNWKVTATAMMEIGQELTNTLMAQSEARYNAEYSRLEQQKNISLKFAGDNADAKAEIERQYEDRRKAIQRRQAEAEKRQAMFSIAINTAQAIMATLGKTGFAGIPLSVIVGAVGAVQLAMVASQEIPAFAQGGEHNGGLMLINDAKGSNFEETIVTPDGKAKKYKGRNVVVDAPKGTQIYTPEQWQKMSVKQSINNGINKDDLDSVFRKYSNSQEVEININENGFKKMISSNGRTREILNSRLTTKSRIV